MDGTDGMFRTTDGYGSRQAASEMVQSGTVSKHECRIMAALDRWERECIGLLPNTTQLAALAGLTNVQVTRRLAKMEEDGKLRRVKIEGQRMRVDRARGERPIDQCVLQPVVSILQPEKAIDAMQNRGGSFIRALANCWLAADAMNKQRLVSAFSAEFKRYTQMFND